MGKRYPREFHDDVVRVARSSDTQFAQLAKDFGVSEASICNWVKQADIDGGVRPGLTAGEQAHQSYSFLSVRRAPRGSNFR